MIVECVPNFSEGRDVSVIEALEDAVKSTERVALLDRHMDADHNRTVLTFAGDPVAVLDAAVRVAKAGCERIDLRKHHGVHPRIGAVDVIPFVPVSRLTLSGCAGLAHKAGRRIWSECGVPVYFYEAAALRPDRRNLAQLRRGGFEGLARTASSDPSRAPDVGGPGLHPTAGAVAVGARPFLIAYNINLQTADVACAERIARLVRESGGGLPGVKAMGVFLASRQQAQVSMNIVDFERAPLHHVFAAVNAEADREGVRVASSELVGLVPRRAIEISRGHDLRWENFDERSILEKRLAEAGLA